MLLQSSGRKTLFWPHCCLEKTWWHLARLDDDRQRSLVPRHHYGCNEHWQVLQEKEYEITTFSDKKNIVMHFKLHAFNCIFGIMGRSYSKVCAGFRLLHISILSCSKTVSRRYSGEITGDLRKTVSHSLKMTRSLIRVQKHVREAPGLKLTVSSEDFREKLLQDTMTS